MGTTVSLNQECESLESLQKMENAGVLLFEAMQAVCAVPLG